MFCPACGVENQPQSTHCAHCGAPLPQAPATPVAPTAPAAPQAYQQPTPAPVPTPVPAVAAQSSVSQPAQPAAYPQDTQPATYPQPAPAQPQGYQQGYQSQGYQQSYQQAVPSYTADPHAPYAAGLTSTDHTLRLIAFILMVISTAFAGLSIFASNPTVIAIAWGIPMTIHAWGIYKGRKRNSVAFAVCTLIFLNIISGILLLCSRKENY